MNQPATQKLTGTNSVELTGDSNQKILGIGIKLVSDATVGNRQIEVEVYSGSDIYAKISAGAVQAASLTRRYFFGPGLEREAAFVTDNLLAALSSVFILPKDFTLKIYDSTNVSVGGDAIEVYLITEQIA